MKPESKDLDNDELILHMTAKLEIKEFNYYSDTNEASDVRDEKKGQKIEK